MALSAYTHKSSHGKYIIFHTYRIKPYYISNITFHIEEYSWLFFIFKEYSIYYCFSHSMWWKKLVFTSTDSWKTRLSKNCLFFALSHYQGNDQIVLAETAFTNKLCKRQNTCIHFRNKTFYPYIVCIASLLVELLCKQYRDIHI